MTLHGQKVNKLVEYREALQNIRAQRSRLEHIRCIRVELTKSDSFLFHTIGATGELYFVEIGSSIDLWPPTCTCEDSTWRPELRCKHILLVLRELGLSEYELTELEWEQYDEAERNNLLVNAPDVA